MSLMKILPYSHHLLISSLKDGDIAIDATVGNGNDTLLLARLVGKNGFVYGFDIQIEAIENTKKRLELNDAISQVKLFQKGHQYVKECIPKEHWGKVKAAIFNLGYLPKGNKQIVTRPETTIEAIEQLLDILSPKGIIILVVYYGHEEGKIEREQLETYLHSLDQNKANVLKYQFINQKNDPPYILAVEKKSNIKES